MLITNFHNLIYNFFLLIVIKIWVINQDATWLLEDLGRNKMKFGGYGHGEG
jgi:hypothetical protein